MNAERLLAHYDRIADAPDAIPRLRALIRALAVRGRLAQQYAGEATLFKCQPLSKDVPSPQPPFDVPKTWRWARVREVGDARLGKMLDKARNRGTLRRYLRNVNVRWFDFDLADVAEMPFEDSELEEFSLRLGDVMVCEGGEPGRAAVWDGREESIYFQKAIHRVRLSPKLVHSPFFVVALKSSAEDGRLEAYFTGTGIKHLTGKGLSEFLFPIPPLPEQHRIVAKIDELMAILDRLEKSQARASEVRRSLLEALIHEALRPARKSKS